MLGWSVLADLIKKLPYLSVSVLLFVLFASYTTAASKGCLLVASTTLPVMVVCAVTVEKVAEIIIAMAIKIGVNFCVIKINYVNE
jgi:hypothetical protein